jgi:hypothetical protein
MALFFALALLLQTPAAPPRDGPAPNVSESFTIRGGVTDAISGQPLQGVQVGVSPMSERMMAGRGALTDADGKWEVTGLVAGDYTLSHAKLGYNRVRGVRIYSPVHVSAQHPVREVELVLMRGGVISGRVLDPLGEAMPGVHVSALRIVNNEAYSATRGDTTDDRGAFRLYGLEPGDFYVSALPDGRHTAENTAGTQRNPIITYYPGTPNVSEAERVVLGEQGEISDLTFQVQTAATFNVSGRVVTSAGSFRDGSVQLYDDDARQVQVRGHVPRSGISGDGRFAVAGVLPGEYVVATNVNLDDGEEIGEARIVVEDKDVDIVVQTRGPTLLSGRVVSAAGTAPPFKTLRILAFPAEAERSPMMRGGNAAIQADGTFQVESFASRVRLRVDAPSDPLGWRVQEIRLRGQHVRKTGLDVGTDSGPVTGIEVVIVGNTARVRGTAKASDGTPLPEGTVVVVPEEPDPDEPLMAFRAVITAGTFVSRPITPRTLPRRGDNANRYRRHHSGTHRPGAIRWLGNRTGRP